MFCLLQQFEIRGHLVRGLKANNTRKPLEFRLAIGTYRILGLSDCLRPLRNSQFQTYLIYFQLTVYFKMNKEKCLLL